MSTYVVGDIQGCLAPLLALLENLDFDPSKDKLISVGDLVNRGPQSLQTLRFCMDLGNAFQMVLGNHDLHLLAVAEGVRKPNRKDTLQDILEAPDAAEILAWLRRHPLLLEIQGYHIVHAGIPHIWTIDKAHQLAAEVSAVIQSEQHSLYFNHMYGNSPETWSDDLQGPERWRVITNYLTRMRFCTQQGQLELSTKDRLQMPQPFNPWFSYQRKEQTPINIVFGHWAALQGKNCGNNLFALDTGYVWGGSLRIMELETKKFFHQYP